MKKSGEIICANLNERIIFEAAGPDAVLTSEVYIIEFGLGRIAIRRNGPIRHKRIGLNWIKNNASSIRLSSDYIISRVQYLSDSILIKKIYWKHEIGKEIINKLLFII